MRIALRELRRRPARFAPVGLALTLLVVLLVVLGGFLDGLELEQTGAFRAQGDRVWVLAEDAELQLQRSSVDEATRAAVAALPGVAAVGRIGTTTTTGTAAGELLDVVVVGYDLATGTLPAPPAAGGVVIDRRLLDFATVTTGDVVAVGPQARPLTVTAVVDDVTQGAPTLWVPMATWEQIAAEASPATAPEPGTAQALVVEATGGAVPAELTAEIAAVAPGATAADIGTVLAGQPVVAQQSATFTAIIGVTYVVALLVTGLFFALLTLERVRLYSVLKAVGARTRDLVGGIAVQALGVAAAAVALGTGLAVALVATLPPDLPLRVLPERLGAIAVGTLLTALTGALLTLRRVLRIDPAASVG
jgi:putative ABC transport system permease protein